MNLRLKTHEELRSDRISFFDYYDINLLYRLCIGERSFTGDVISELLAGAFSWSSTLQGTNYWEQVHFDFQNDDQIYRGSLNSDERPQWMNTFLSLFATQEFDDLDGETDEDY